MNKKVERNYLEINFLKDLKESEHTSERYSITLVEPVDFQVNKFFYKKKRKKHLWIDGLVWSEKQWNNYVPNKKVKAYILKNDEDRAGNFKLILHTEKKEIEIA